MSTVVPRERVNAARLAVLATFALNGWVFATWASRIPDTRHQLGLTPGQLGLLILTMSIGSLVALPLSGRITPRIGAKRAVQYGGALAVLGLLLAGLTVGVWHSALITAAPLVVMGFGIGLWDVSMNLEGATVEHQWGATVMPHFHAAFSLGTVISALIGAGTMAVKIPLWAHLIVTAIIVGVVNWVVATRFLPHSIDAEESAAQEESAHGDSAAGSAWLEPRTLLIGFVTLVAAFTEGTANDWVSVAIVDAYDLPVWAGTIGFAVFLSFMTIGRFFGTGLLDRYGRLPVLRITFAMALVGSLLLVFGPVWAAYVGAASWGFGVALGFPVGMSAAADDPMRAAQRLSVVSTVAYMAFLAGPASIGWLGDHVGVQKALLAVGALLVPAWFLLPVLREPAKNDTAADSAADDATGAGSAAAATAADDAR